jgi:plasmid stability protein
MIALCVFRPKKKFASLHVRHIEAGVKEQLRIRAAHNGRSMEAEARAILKEALICSHPITGASLVQAIRRRFEPLGGVDLELPSREGRREPPNLA